MLRDWVIYKITSPSGRVYIGKSYNFTNRLNQYKNGSHKNQPIIYRSIKKYGFNNHKIDVIDRFNSDKIFAAGKERFWIRSYMSNICKYPNFNGMNMTDGGEGTLGIKLSDERKKAISVFNKTQRVYGPGVKKTDAQKQHISKVLKGRKISDDVKKRCRDGLVLKSGKRVLCSSHLDGSIIEFLCLADCANYFKATPETIRSIINGKTKRPNYRLRCFTFKYKQNGFSS